MELNLQPRKEVWRGRGAPRKEIPEEIRAAANATYRTGQVGVVHYGADEEPEVKELIGLLTSYGNSFPNRRMRVQHEDGEIRFELVDKNSRKKAI